MNSQVTTKVEDKTIIDITESTDEDSDDFLVSGMKSSADVSPTSVATVKVKVRFNVSYRLNYSCNIITYLSCYLWLISCNIKIEPGLGVASVCGDNLPISSVSSTLLYKNLASTSTQTDMEYTFEADNRKKMTEE